jgi:hypothetical protein
MKTYRNIISEYTVDILGENYISEDTLSSIVDDIEQDAQACLDKLKEVDSELNEEVLQDLGMLVDKLY